VDVLPFHRRTYAEVDTRHIQRNFQTLRALLPKSAFFCPMVKANAYGHGDVQVARALRQAGAEYLGVGLIEEGMNLRLSGDTGKLLLMGIFEPRSAHAVLEFELTPVISAWHELESLKELANARVGSAAPVQSVPIHIKFNTGMNRLGFDVSQAPQLRTFIDQNRILNLQGICTHLLRGDDAGIPGGQSESQFLAFAQALSSFADLPVQVHALNSSGTVTLWNRVLKKKDLGSAARWPMGARPGLAIYGISPSTDEAKEVEQSLRVEPAMSLKSHIVMVHRLEKGERVSYGPTWHAARPSLIGVVPVGYGDGYFRSLSNKGVVLVDGLRCPVVGNVCMDYIMVDLTDIEQRGLAPGMGDEVVLLGKQTGSGGSDQITAQELAELVGTIPYEILTNITERVPRIHLK
jgi:alanine racemase